MYINPLEGLRKTSDLTVLEYFMAHAPAVPQPWFKPNLSPKPTHMSIKDAPTSLKPALQQWTLKGTMPDSPDGRAWVEAWEARDKEINAWEQERTKQILVQWPAAWARAVMGSLEVN